MTIDEEVVQAFEDSARLYGAAVQSMDVKTINKHSHRMSRLFQQVLQSQKIRKRFLDLLHHSEPSVRLMAAAFGLNIDEDSCIRELQALKSGDDFRFEAEQCLRRWSEGEWALDAPEAVVEPSAVGSGVVEVRDIVSFGSSVERQVPLADVSSREDLDMRIGCVNVYFANIIGIGQGFIEFCPNCEPPANEEVLAWTWVIRPELKERVLLDLGNHEFAEGVRQLG